MLKELLLEIGTEEIPAAFLPKALREMEEAMARRLEALRITHGRIVTMGAPRRLVLCVQEVTEQQQDQLLEKLGPAKKAAYDEQGRPSKAALGFARGQGLDVADLEMVTTEKGEYLRACKTVQGVETNALLPEMMTGLITGLSFRKSMRWSDFELRFARPIHWIVALFGGDIIPFKIENITSGRRSFGHRFMSPVYFEVADFADYIEKARAHHVIVDPAERKAIILQEAERAARAVPGIPMKNDDLLETVTYLVEYPSAVCGSFDPAYLDLPQEVLTTSMMSHQKYFPVMNEKGDLLPHFITINNTLARDPAVVTRGNERVIRARLSDARFFFEEDQKIPLEKRVEDLKKVVYHSLLGTSYEKVMRFRSLADYLALQINPALRATVDRAAFLAKADLDTLMVGEFSELQGIMGREYAARAGEDPFVAAAIYEHYLPIAAGGALPQTDEGAIVSLADKLDTIVGFFGVNLGPTGTADPYALRRQALGIINIILSKGYTLDLDAAIGKSIAIMGEKMQRPAAEVKQEVLEFFRARFENQLLGQGRTYDVVDAVLATGISDLGKSCGKIESMEAFKSHPDFQPLAIAFKRVGNIIKGFSNGRIDPALFQTAAESSLYDALQDIEKKALDLLEEDRFEAALVEMARLREPVDAFFNAVMVMDKDEAVRFNRLSLLSEISGLFHRVADFSKIVTEG